MIIRPMDDDIFLLLTLKVAKWHESLEETVAGLLEIQTTNEEIIEDCIRDGGKNYLLIYHIKNWQIETENCFIATTNRFISRHNYNFKSLLKLTVPPLVDNDKLSGYLSVTFNG